MPITRIVKGPALETAMPRPRGQMTYLLNSLKDTIQEHIMKLVFFREDRPQDVNGWLKSLNKHLVKLRTYNKSAKGFNYDETQLRYELDEYQIGILDAALIAFEEKGYPERSFSPTYRKDCLSILDRYIECILSNDENVKLTIKDLP